MDVAAWRLCSVDTFRATGAICDLSDDIELNLVDTAACSQALLQAIEREGVEL